MTATAALPDRMIAIKVTQPGGPEVLVPVELPVPSPGPDEVLIRVRAAGVNRPDLLQRQGLYPPPPGAPDTPGLEVAGEIAAVGPGTARWQVGDKVTALVAGGGYAEFCIAPAPQCLPVPDGLDMVEAGALPETFFTVWVNVFERGRLQPGETLLVHGGASGIGTTAIMVASGLGARVFATAGGPEKCAACEKLGAARAIDYRTEDFVEVVRKETGGKGVDVVLDMIGGPTVARNIQALAQDGRLSFIAFLEGSRIEVDLLPVMLKRLTITGSTLRARPVAYKGQVARALEERVWPLLAGGKFKPVIDSTFPLKDAAAAHERLESRGTVGKVVLVP
jgi:putative PIG3 family NAD(P)H quinone oxidoreductase